MRNDNKNQIDVKANEFRYNKARGGHPSYTVRVIKTQQNRKAKFIGLTESDTTFGVKNIPLDKNPNPARKDKKAYARPNVDEVVLTKKTFSKKLNGWEFSVSDKAKIQVIIVNDSKKTKK